MTSGSKRTVVIHYPGRFKIEYSYSPEETAALEPVHSVSVSGSRRLVTRIQELQKQSLDPAAWPVPKGISAEDLVLKEFILRVGGQWNPPYDEDLICFCRKITTHAICEAIISGVHHIEDLRELTSANTGCGTCQDRTEELIGYYVKTNCSD